MSFVRAALRRVALTTRAAVHPAGRLRLAVGAAAAASTAGALWLSVLRAAPARAEKAAAAAAAAAEKPKADAAAEAKPKATKAKAKKGGKSKKAKAAAAAVAAEQKRVDELIAAAVAEGYDPEAYAKGAEDGSTSAAVDPTGSPVVTPAGGDTPARYVIAQLREDGNSGVTGVVFFEQPHPRAPVKVRAVVKGLKAGKHGLHVHEFGDLRQGCVTAGPHFNPLSAPHGGPGDNRAARHSGDLGNITAAAADANGEAVFVRYEHPNFIGLYGGIQTVVGRSVVVHADEDDLGRGGHADSKTTGHAGARLACGVIGLMAPPAPAAAAPAAAPAAKKA